VCITHPRVGGSSLQTLGISEDEEIQMVMDLLSKCRRDCEIEVGCMTCLSEKLSVLRIKIK